jgi:hypothetical protein
MVSLFIEPCNLLSKSIGIARMTIYSLQCILGDARIVVPRKYDKLEYGIDISSLS